MKSRNYDLENHWIGILNSGSVIFNVVGMTTPTKNMGMYNAHTFPKIYVLV